MKTLEDVIDYIKDDEEVYIATWNVSGSGTIDTILYTGTIKSMPYEFYKLYRYVSVWFISKQRDRLAIILNDAYCPLKTVGRKQ